MPEPTLYVSLLSPVADTSLSLCFRLKHNIITIKVTEADIAISIPKLTLIATINVVSDNAAAAVLVLVLSASSIIDVDVDAVSSVVTIDVDVITISEDDMDITTRIQ